MRAVIALVLWEEAYILILAEHFAHKPSHEFLFLKEKNIHSVVKIIFLYYLARNLSMKWPLVITTVVSILYNTGIL